MLCKSDKPSIIIIIIIRAKAGDMCEERLGRWCAAKPLWRLPDSGQPMYSGVRGCSGWGVEDVRRGRQRRGGGGTRGNREEGWLVDRAGCLLLQSDTLEAGGTG